MQYKMMKKLELIGWRSRKLLKWFWRNINVSTTSITKVITLFSIEDLWVSLLLTNTEYNHIKWLTVGRGPVTVIGSGWTTTTHPKTKKHYQPTVLNSKLEKHCFHYKTAPENCYIYMVKILLIWKPLIAFTLMMLR